MSLLNRLPPLNALRAFEAVARHLSFARAGQELHVTKAAVAQQVRALEQEVGARRSRGECINAICTCNPQPDPNFSKPGQAQPNKTK